MQVEFPPYINGLAAEEKSIAATRFLIRLAALHYSVGGTVAALSEGLGLHPNTLAGTTVITAEMAIRLEEILGRDRFPRAVFRPDLFLIEE